MVQFLIPFCCSFGVVFSCSNVYVVAVLVEYSKGQDPSLMTSGEIKGLNEHSKVALSPDGRAIAIVTGSDIVIINCIDSAETEAMKNVFSSMLLPLVLVPDTSLFSLSPPSLLPSPSFSLSLSPSPSLPPPLSLLLPLHHYYTPIALQCVPYFHYSLTTVFHPYHTTITKLFTLSGRIRHIMFSGDSRYIICCGDRHLKIFHNVIGYRAKITDFKRLLVSCNKNMEKRLTDQLEEARSVDICTLSLSRSMYVLQVYTICLLFCRSALKDIGFNE